MKIALPPKTGMPKEWQDWFEQITKQMQEIADRIEPRNNTIFTVTNHTATQSLDVATATLTDTQNFLATLATALKKTQIIK